MFTWAKWLEEIDLVTRRKEQLVKAKTNQKLMEDKTLIAKLCAMMNLEPSEDNVGQCGILKIQEEESQWKRHLPVLRIVSPLLLEYIMRRVRLFEINERLDVAIAETVPITSRIHLSGLNCIEIKPSDIMKDHAKIELLFSIFDANGKLSFSEWHGAMADANMFAEVLKKADLLFVMLSSCFQTHVKLKVKVCQQLNRCFAWAKKNLALVACWMIVACHLKEDISCLD